MSDRFRNGPNLQYVGAARRPSGVYRNRQISRNRPAETRHGCIPSRWRRWGAMRRSLALVGPAKHEIGAESSEVTVRKTCKNRRFLPFQTTLSAARGCKNDSSPLQAPPEAKPIRGRRLLSPAGGGDFGHLRVQNGHFPYIFKGLVGASKKQKDAHLKIRSNAPMVLLFS